MLGDLKTEVINLLSSHLQKKMLMRMLKISLTKYLRKWLIYFILLLSFSIKYTNNVQLTVGESYKDVIFFNSEFCPLGCWSWWKNITFRFQNNSWKWEVIVRSIWKMPTWREGMVSKCCENIFLGIVCLHNLATKGTVAMFIDIHKC